MLSWLTNLYDINKVSCIRLSGIGGLVHYRLECWNGLNYVKALFLDMTAFLKVVTHSFSSVTCSMPCLGILPQSLGGQ